MKKVVLGLILGLSINIYSMENLEQESNEQIQALEQELKPKEIKAISKIARLGFLLDRQNSSSLLFIAALHCTKKQVEEINQSNIPQELKEYIIKLKYDLNQKSIINLNLFLTNQNLDRNDLKLLIEAGADINLQNQLENNALICAVMNGDLDLAKFLIDKHAQVDIKNIFGSNPLILAASRGYLDMVRLLINSNAAVNLVDDNDSTALMYAIIFGHNEVARFLLNKNADINAQNKDGDTPLILAHKYRRTEIIELLESKINA